MRTFVLVTAALLGLAAARANAQTKQGQQDVGLNVGVAIPTSNDGFSNTIGKAGVGAGASYDYMLTKNISVGGDFLYRGFGNSSPAFMGNTGTYKPHNWSLLATGKYHFMPDSQWRPYGLIGLGVGNESLEATFNTFDVTGTGTGFAWAVGAGVDYDLNSQWAAGLEARYSGLSATLSNNVGSQSMNSVDILASAHYKFGGM